MTTTLDRPIVSDELLDEARRRTGLEDFGDFDLISPLKLLCESLNTEAKLNAFGEMVARERLSTILDTRLQVVEDRKRIPDIANQRIERPIVLVGLPRTGTTVLFNVLAQDPDNRVPLNWETLLSSPPPEAATYYSDPRIDKAQALMTRWGHNRPEIYAIHPMGARLAEECPFICEQVMVNTAHFAFWNVAKYTAATAAVGRVDVFTEHKRVLQHLQARNPGKRWLLKAPTHLMHLPEFTAVYPDAAFVMTHRDLRKVLPSFASLQHAHRKQFSDAPENTGIDQMVRSAVTMLSERLRRANKFIPTAKQDFEHFLYRDIATDPMGVVRSIYQRLDLELIPATVTKMEAWLAQNRKGSHGKADYSLAAAGVTDEQIDTAFGDYMERYGVPAEK